MTPNVGWGGEGSLGCGIGYGYLHRIPLRNDKSTKLTQIQTQSINQVCTLINFTSILNQFLNVILRGGGTF